MSAAAASVGEPFTTFLGRAGALGGLSSTSVLQGIGDILQMEQILGPKEWSDNPSVVQVARIKSTIGKCPIDFGKYSTNPTYNDQGALWWEEVNQHSNESLSFP